MSRRTTPALIAIAVLAAGCGGGGPVTTSTGATQASPAAPVTEPAGPAGNGTTAHPHKPSGPAEGPEGDPRTTELESSAARTARDYVDAIDARDGERVCSLLVGGALATVELPVSRGGPCESVGASIGYRDPRGLPVWSGARVSRIRSVELDGDAARVVATTVTRFADRDEVSIEDDLIYLSRAGGRWLVAKPSSTLYRAVGVADVPPSVLSPP